jgi:hypothetical protein
MLTQLSTLKTRLKIPLGDTADDVILNLILDAVSGRFDEECNRAFARGAGVTYEFEANLFDLCPLCYPVESVTKFELKQNESEGFAEQAGVTYVLSPNKTLVQLDSPLGVSTEVGRITYSGGYVLPGTVATAGQTALPDVIEAACMEQCAFWYQNRTRLGLSSVSSAGASISVPGQNALKPQDLLPQVSNVLRRFERLQP